MDELKTANDEWEDLLKSLSEEEQKNGKACFYCGILLGLNISYGDTSKILYEIEKALWGWGKTKSQD